MRISILMIIVLLSLSAPVVAGKYSNNHVRAVQYFQSSKEPTAKDAIWTQETIFKVGVIDKGSDRSGYAQYVCSMLDDFGFKGKKTWVQIINIVKLTRDGDWVKLGEARCR